MFGDLLESFVLGLWQFEVDENEEDEHNAEEDDKAIGAEVTLWKEIQSTTIKWQRHFIYLRSQVKILAHEWCI